MAQVIADISMSLDGFVTGPQPDLEHGLGRGGEPLHAWALSSDDEVDTQILQESTTTSGAVIMGRRLFDIIDGPGGWNDEMGYGADQVGTPPFFVVTHAPPASIRLELDFTFVPGGLSAAVEQARAAAGDKDVVVMGGGDVVRQSVEHGVADLLRIHLAPIVLGSGTPLFGGGWRRQLVQQEVRVSTAATHITYLVAD